MTNLTIRLNIFVFLIPILLICLSGMSFAYIGENADGWDWSFPIAEQCFKPGPDGTPVGQMGGNICISNALKDADAELNAIYKKLSSVMVEQAMLRDSQRAWLKFRDLECKLRTSGMDEDGSAFPFMYDKCILDLTLKRVKDLKHLDAESWCNGCPVRKDNK